MRQLLIETDGALLDIKKCEFTPLELKTTFDALLELVLGGKFPLPNGLPALSFPEEKPEGVAPKPVETILEALEENGRTED